MPTRFAHFWIKIAGAALLAMLACPLIILIGVSLNPGVEQLFPPSGLSLRWYFNLANRDGFVAATRLTLLLALWSALASVVIATLAGIAIVRYRFPGRDLVLTLLLSPLIVPQVVVGMAFLITLSAMGIFSSVLTLAILHVVITLPFATRVVVAALSGASIRLEEAARSLGATPAKAFLLVTLPLVRSGVIAAAVFAFVVSFENFTASQFLVWDRTTLPVELYTYVQTENDPTAAAISSLIVLSAIAFVVAFNGFISRHMFGSGSRK
ncbi:MAG: ABC transporter permease [Hyphomicrobiaceae bacterium]|nr:ABC transporter permease [Hyphomicrobiaceae bacterium]